MTSQSIPINALFKVIVRSLYSLKESIRNDAENGAAALTFNMSPLHLHPKESMIHPWVAKSFNSDFPHHERIMAAFSHMSFEAHSDPTRTFSFPGVLSASPQTILQALKINELKVDFKDAVLEFKNANKGIKDSDIGDAIGRFGSSDDPDSDYGVGGLSGICIKEVYRFIPVFGVDQPLPERLAYYYKLKQPSKTSTAKAVLDRLMAKVAGGDTSDGTQAAIRMLNTIDGCTKVSIRQTPSEGIVVNTKLPPIEPAKAKWVQMTGNLPLIIPQCSLAELEKIVKFSSLDVEYLDRPISTGELATTPSSQAKWQPQPFIPAMSLYLPIGS
jgi:hypothetical protein